MEFLLPLKAVFLCFGITDFRARESDIQRRTEIGAEGRFLLC
jgi:hypothetical protein